METQQDTPVGEIVETASQLASQAKEQVDVAAENLLDTLADQLEDFADQLRKEDLNSLFEHVRSTAERSPELFFAGSVATGLALARFVKASAHRREGREREDGQRVESERQPQQSPPSPSARTMSPNPPELTQ
jgi:ABC-type transporter Mla subunit MlaD